MTRKAPTAKISSREIVDEALTAKINSREMFKKFDREN